MSLSNQWTHYQASGGWKLILNMPIPTKIKHFCWRLFRCCLPTQGCGFCDSLCVVCNNDIEDEKHMFMHCTFAINCWMEANLWGKIDRYMTSSGRFSSIISTILAALTKKFVLIFEYLMKYLAFTQCLFMEKKKLVNVTATCSLASYTV